MSVDWCPGVVNGVAVVVGVSLDSDRLELGIVILDKIRFPDLVRIPVRSRDRRCEPDVLLARYGAIAAYLLEQLSKLAFVV